MREPAQPDWAGSPDLIAYFREHRAGPDEIYRSERRFLPWLAAQSASVLDVGCAAGGFSATWRAFRPDIRYTGLDISAPLVEEARRLHPDCTFVHGDAAAGVDLPDGAVELVAALGWLHWEPRWHEALAELWRLAGRCVFFDCRLALSPQAATVGRQRLELTGAWDGVSATPYIVASWPELAAALLALRPARILGFGYAGAPAASVEGVAGEVVFATFVVERPLPGAAPERPQACLDLPLAWPSELARRADILSPQDLDELVPVLC